MTTFDFPDQGMEPPHEHDDETVDGAHRRASVEWFRMKGAARAEYIDEQGDGRQAISDILRLSKRDVDSDAYEVLCAALGVCRLESDDGIVEWRKKLDRLQPELVPILDKYARRAAGEQKLDVAYCDARVEELLAEEEGE